MKFGFYLAFGFLISAAAFAASDDRIPLNEGEKELFGMRDMKAGQCAVSFTDTETGWSPIVSLKSLTMSTGGNFRGGVYLQQWNNTFSDREYIVSVQYFTGDAGRKILKAEVYVNYGKKFDKNDINKSSRHVLLIDPSNNVYDFKEKLKIERPGTYNITDLVSVPQQVLSNGKSVSFSRVANGINIDLTCTLTEI